MHERFWHDILLACGGILAILPLHIYSCRITGRRWLLPLIPLLDGRAGEQTGTFNWTLRGRYRRRTVTIEIASLGQTGKRYQVEVVCTAVTRFVIQRDNLLRSASNAMSAMQIIDVGDARLDQEYACASGDPGRFAAWVRHPEISTLVLTLFEQLGMQALSCGNGGLRCSYSTGRPRAPDVDRMRRTLESLQALAESLEAHHQERWAMDG